MDAKSLLDDLASANLDTQQLAIIKKDIDKIRTRSALGCTVALCLMIATAFFNYQQVSHLEKGLIALETHLMLYISK